MDFQCCFNVRDRPVNVNVHSYIIYRALARSIIKIYIINIYNIIYKKEKIRKERTLRDETVWLWVVQCRMICQSRIELTVNVNALSLLSQHHSRSSEQSDFFSSRGKKIFIPTNAKHSIFMSLREEDIGVNVNC